MISSVMGEGNACLTNFSVTVVTVVTIVTLVTIVTIVTVSGNSSSKKQNFVTVATVDLPRYDFLCDGTGECLSDQFLLCFFSIHV